MTQVGTMKRNLLWGALVVSTLLWTGCAFAHAGGDVDPEMAEVFRQCAGVAEFARMHERSKPVKPDAEDPALPGLRDELLAMEQADQEVRRGESTDFDVDARNLVRLREIIAEHGFPTSALVSTQGVAAAWLLVQHADDVALQEQILQAIAPPHPIPQGIDGQKIALLTDRVLLRQGKPQRYGSQLRMGENGLEPSPIEEEATVDERRMQMGMMPLADYLCMVQVMSAG